MTLFNWRQPALLALLRLLRPVTYRELMLLRRLEHAPAAEIRELHERRLERLLRHAWQHTDYYHEVLGDCGVVRDGNVDLGRFEELPILSKEVIRAAGPRLRARQLPPGRKSWSNRTGGSTGQPLEYWQDDHYWDVNVATKLFHFEVLGKRLGEPELKVWGSERDATLEAGARGARLQNWLYNRRIRLCRELKEQDLEALVAEINTFRPRSVWGFVDALYTLAEYVNRTGRALHAPAAVLSGGGTLLPPMADSISRAFDAPVANFYGSREMGDVACECDRTQGLHVSSNSHKVEILDAGGHAVVEQDGEIILTALHNYAMPFIRYRIGDRGRLTARGCACGRNFPLLESVGGRALEAFVRNDGAVISPLAFASIVRTLVEPDLIDRVQFVQEDYDRVLVKIVVAAGAAQGRLHDHCGRIGAKVKEVMGQRCDVRFEHVTHIPPTTSGKYLYTISKVPQRAPDLARFSA